MKAQRKNRVNYSIRKRLVLGFLIPVVFIIILGVVSFWLASRGMVSNYINSSKVSLNMMGEYFDLGLTNISSKAIDIITDETTQKYYSKYYSGKPTDEISRYKEIQKKILAAVAADKSIADITVFADYGHPVSTAGTLKDSLYSEFLASEDHTVITGDGKELNWIGTHPYLDTVYKVNTPDYGISYIKKITNSAYKQIGYVVIDVDRSFFTGILKKSDFGSGSISGFVTADGKSIMNGEEKAAEVITQSAYYKQALKGKEASAADYVIYNESKYLFVYAKSAVSGSLVFALIPETLVTEQANAVKIVTILIMILAVVIALFVGISISGSISAAIGKTNYILDAAATGNLSQELRLKRKDEFRLLAQSINSMFEGMRTLIRDIFRISRQTTEMSSKVSKSSEILVNATKDIALTTTEIEEGISSLAKDAQNCYITMSDLAGLIGTQEKNAGNIQAVAGETEDTLRKGLENMDALNRKQRDTSEITRAVINNITALEKQSAAIINIVEAINEIAEQTRLLSLNASIEAARAGSYGKSFSIVADEIRKLSDQSSLEAGRIAAIVAGIQKGTADTARVATKADDIVLRQERTLKETTEGFSGIRSHVTRLTESLNEITTGLARIGELKSETLGAVESISATLEETSAASAQLGDTANEQLKAVEDLKNTVEELNKEAERMESSVKMFRLS